MMKFNRGSDRCDLLVVGRGIFLGSSGLTDLVFFFKQKTAYEMLRSLWARRCV